MRTRFGFGIAAILLTYFFSANAELIVEPNSHAQCLRFLSEPLVVSPEVLRELARIRQEVIAKNHPPHVFKHAADDAAHEYPKETRQPKSIEQNQAKNTAPSALTAPTVKDPSTVGTDVQTNTYPVIVDVPHGGRNAQTTAWISKPFGSPLKGENDYAIGPENKVVHVYLHGVGTSTAIGVNGATLGDKIAAMGQASISLDIFGHGMATKNPEGLVSREEQIGWFKKTLQQLVHPGVKKFVITGHSGGAMWVLLMRYYFADDPWFKDKDITYFALSPGQSTDVSFANKVENEISFEEHLKKYEEDGAKGDVKFFRNHKFEGKLSNSSSIAQLERIYNLPKLTPEQEARLPRLTVIMGQYDLITYLGREQHFWNQFISLAKLGGGDGPAGSFNTLELTDKLYNAPRKVIMMPAGITHESKDKEDLIKTGHQVADVRSEDGNYLFVHQLIMHEINRLSEGVNPPAKTGDAAQDTLNIVTWYYNKYPAFREVVERYTSFVKMDGENLRDLEKRDKQLKKYIESVDKERRKKRGEIELALKTAVESLRIELGIEDVKIKDGDEDRELRLNEAKALAELQFPPLTDERKRQLEAFAEEHRQIEKGIERPDSPYYFSDGPFEDKIKELREKFASDFVIGEAGFGFTEITYSNTREAYKEFEKRNAEIKIRSEIIKQLKYIHERLPLDRNNPDRFKKLSARVTPILNHLGVSNIEDYLPFYNEWVEDKSKEEKLNADKSLAERFGAFQAAYVAALKKHNILVDQEFQKKIAALRLKYPELPEMGEALAELYTPRSPERRAKVARFVAEIGEARAAAENKNKQELALEIAKIRLPDGVKSLEDAESESKAIQAMLDFTASTEFPEVQNLAHQIRSEIETLDRLINGVVDDKGQVKVIALSKLAKDVEDAHEQKLSVTKRWNALWETKEGEQPKLTSNRLKEAEKSLGELKDIFAQQDTIYRNSLRRYQAQLDRENNFNGTTLIDLPTYLVRMEERSLNAFEVFKRQEALLAKLRFEEALSGQLIGSDEDKKHAMDYAKAIYGTEFLTTGQPGAKSVTRQLEIYSDYLKVRREQIALVEQNLNGLRHDYAQLMIKLGQKVPYYYQIVSIWDLLDQDKETVLGLLRIRDGQKEGAPLRALRSIVKIAEDLDFDVKQRSQE